MSKEVNKYLLQDDKRRVILRPHVFAYMLDWPPRVPFHSWNKIFVTKL